MVTWKLAVTERRRLTRRTRRQPKRGISLEVRIRLYGDCCNEYRRIREGEGGGGREAESRKIKSYQCVSRLVLINRADSGPVEVQQQCHSRRVQSVLGWHDPEEVREAVGREHGMSIRVAELQQAENRERENTFVM